MTGAAERTPVSYIDKSREFYAAHGYERPYRWASNDETPFTKLRQPLEELNVGVVTTSFPVSFTPPKQVSRHASTPVPDAMFTADLSWDKEATHTDDVASFLPLARLHELAAAGRIGSVAPRFFCVPTEYSQRRTGDDAGQIVAWAAEDEIDLLLLIPL